MAENKRGRKKKEIAEKEVKVSVVAENNEVSVVAEDTVAEEPIKAEEEKELDVVSEEVAKSVEKPMVHSANEVLAVGENTDMIDLKENKDLNKKVLKSLGNHSDIIGYSWNGQVIDY